MEREKFKERFTSLLKDPEYMPVDPFLKEVKQKKKKLNPPDLMKTGRFECSTQTIRNWLSGESIPNASNIEVLADLFGVSTAWLSGYIDTSKFEEVDDYEPFKKLGFSYEAWKTLTELYNSFLETTANPQDATSKMTSTLQGVNSILEMIGKMGSVKSIHNNRFDVLHNPFDTSTSFGVPILSELSNFLDVKDPSFINRLTDYLDLNGYLEDRDYLTQEDEKVLRAFCNSLLINNPNRLINPIENDLIVIGKLTEQLKHLKLYKIKEELQEVVLDITDDKNRDFREELTTEELTDIDDGLLAKYTYLFSLFKYYSSI